MKIFTEGNVTVERLDQDAIMIKVGARPEITVSLGEFSDLIKCGERLLGQRRKDLELMARVGM
ncbi:MAG: hypothetical protein ACHP9V_07495 [Terriglobales bacterium]